MGFDAPFQSVPLLCDDGDGLCGHGDDEECHTVVVSLTNNVEKNRIPNMFYWEGCYPPWA